MKKKNILRIPKMPKSLTKKIEGCSHCFGIGSKLVSCSHPDCDIKVCRGCATYINNAVFCPGCILDIINKDVVHIIFDNRKYDEYKEKIKGL